MKISVVIPAYNEEKYLENCLKSLMEQEEKADEIIVVDNNSTDKTRAIARKYPVTVVSEKKQGMIYARNRGFNTARFDIIARTDADTQVPKNWIKKIKKRFESKNLIALAGPAQYYPNASTSTVANVSKWPTQIFFNTVKQILGHDCLYGPNMSLRKSAWEQVKNKVCLEDKDVHEDIDLTIHLAHLGIGRIKFDKTLVVKSSPRRWKNITPYFEYPSRAFKTIRRHKLAVFENTSKRIVKKVIPKTLLDQISMANDKFTLL